jgi:hypothetical protein
MKESRMFLQELGLSDKYFNMVDALSQDDFDALKWAVEKRENKNSVISSHERAILEKTRQDIANNINFTNDQKIAGVRIVNKKLGLE